MTEDRSSYRQIFKATSIFGGVQVFNILINIIKSKAVAVLLGAEGMGLLGLFNSTIELIKTFAGFGLSSSAIRDVSETAATHDEYKISSTLKTLKRWVCFTGIFGAGLTIALSSLLSKWTFGNYDYSWSFIWLSVAVFFYSISSGQLAALQGLRRIKDLAKVGLYGAVSGLIVSIILFYSFGLEGIVPSIILTSLCSLFFSWYFNRKVHIVPVKQTYKESYSNGLQMAKLGVMMMLNGLIAIAASYALRIYISHKGGISDVGIFQAGLAIVEGYLGLIYTAMATDYYPRLSAVNQDNIRVKDEVNKQAEIGLLIAAPMIVILLFIMPIVITVLYTSAFLDVVPYVNWAVLGNLFKIGSWSMGFILLAKGKSKIFITTAIIFGITFLLMNILGYDALGIEGIGMAFCINYGIHFLVLYILCSKLYSFRYDREFWKIFISATFLSCCAFITQSIDYMPIKYGLGAFISILICIYSFRKLNQKIYIVNVIRYRWKK